MRTYPLVRKDGVIFAFEISSTWVSFHSIFRALRSVEGVTGVQRNFFNEERASFAYDGKPWVIWEPFGDNSRYWIGPKGGTLADADVEPIHQAFQKLESLPKRLWRRLAGEVA